MGNRVIDTVLQLAPSSDQDLKNWRLNGKAETFKMKSFTF